MVAGIALTGKMVSLVRMGVSDAVLILYKHVGVVQCLVKSVA